jgi:hypothetical protein
MPLGERWIFQVQAANGYRLILRLYETLFMVIAKAKRIGNSSILNYIENADDINGIRVNKKMSFCLKWLL